MTVILHKKTAKERGLRLISETQGVLADSDFFPYISDGERHDVLQKKLPVCLGGRLTTESTYRFTHVLLLRWLVSPPLAVGDQDRRSWHRR